MKRQRLLAMKALLAEIIANREEEMSSSSRHRSKAKHRRRVTRKLRRALEKTHAVSSVGNSANRVGYGSGVSHRAFGRDACNQGYAD